MTVIILSDAQLFSPLNTSSQSQIRAMVCHDAPEKQHEPEERAFYINFCVCPNQEYRLSLGALYQPHLVTQWEITEEEKERMHSFVLRVKAIGWASERYLSWGNDFPSGSESTLHLYITRLILDAGPALSH